MEKTGPFYQREHIILMRDLKFGGKKLSLTYSRQPISFSRNPYYFSRKTCLHDQSHYSLTRLLWINRRSLKSFSVEV